MRWRVRAVDGVAGITAIGVLAAGAYVMLGAPGLADPAGAPGAPSDSPGAVHPTAETDPSPDPRRGQRRPKPVPRGAKVEVEVDAVPDSGAGMQIVLPGEQWAPEALTTVELVVSSFNVLGSSHTASTGDRPHLPAGVTRVRWAAQLIRSHDVGIAGLQELEVDQARVLMSVLPDYDIYPRPSGRRHSTANSIIWDRDEWQAVQSSTIVIPYFKGNPKPMPYVRLRNRATGTDVWVANFHNPASTRRRGDNSRWRTEATRRQIALAEQLRAETGLPVIFTGDFNEKALYFCRLVGSTDLEASNGGSASGGRCSPPNDLGIDWVFGTPEIEWVSSVRDRSALVRRTTDHPMVVAVGRLQAVDGDAVEEARDSLDRLEDSGG